MYLYAYFLMKVSLYNLCDVYEICCELSKILKIIRFAMDQR